MPHVSPSFSATLRLRLDDAPGMFARVAEAIGEAGGSLGAIDIVRVEPHHKIRDVTVSAANEAHLHSVADAVRTLDGIEVLRVSDRTFLMHLGGKIEMQSKVPLKTRDDLSMAYTPGVARISQAIADDPARVEPHRQAEHRRGRVGRDGGTRPRRHRAGGGNAGDGGESGALQGVRRRRCVADLPRHEGSRRDRRDLQGDRPRDLGASISRTSPHPGASRSRHGCGRSSTSPFHDDQHGTAIVVLAALVNALKVVGKRLQDVKIVTTGVGAAGIATTDVSSPPVLGGLSVATMKAPSTAAGQDCPHKVAFAERTNPDDEQCSADEALAGADIFIGLSAPGAVTPAGVRTMAEDAIVFAMANPTPEVLPEELDEASRSLPRAAPTTRTRSTTSSRSPASSEEPSTSAQRRLRRRWRSRQRTRSPARSNRTSSATSTWSRACSTAKSPHAWPRPSPLPRRARASPAALTHSYS